MTLFVYEFKILAFQLNCYLYIQYSLTLLLLYEVKNDVNEIEAVDVTNEHAAVDDVKYPKLHEYLSLNFPQDYQVLMIDLIIAFESY
jgi:hypothetical protein